MPRKKKTDIAAPAADEPKQSAEVPVVKDAPAADEPKQSAEVPVVKDAPAADRPKQKQELSTSDKLRARIAKGDEILVVVNHAGLHLVYPHADTPVNRNKALSLCANYAEGKPLTFLNDDVKKA